MSTRMFKLAMLTLVLAGIIGYSARAIIAQQEPAAEAAPVCVKPADTTKPIGCCFKGDKAKGGWGKKAHGGECYKAMRECYAEMKQNLAVASDSVDAATKAVEADDKTTALAELKKAKAAIAQMRKAVASCPMGKRGIINTLCPMMGTKIDPAKVPADLTRTWKGHKVGFCCAGCPVAWDRLTDEQKKEKLKATKPKAKK